MNIILAELIWMLFVYPVLRVSPVSYLKEDGTVGTYRLIKPKE